MHEAGHALVASFHGARIEEFVVLGVRLWPDLAWVGPGELFGWVSWSGELDPEARAWTGLAGSASTWGLSMLALAFWRKGPGPAPWGPLRAIHLALCLLWLDALCHSLPRIGIPMFVLFGRSQDSPEVAEWIHGWLELGLPEAPLLVLIGVSPLLAAWRLCPRRVVAELGTAPSSADV